MSRRRLVRVTTSFFDRLDELLPEERDAAGSPSTADFLLHELPPIIDRLAEDFESATLAVEGVAGVRVLITAGRLVGYVAIYSILTAEGAVEIVYLEVDDVLR